MATLMPVTPTAAEKPPEVFLSYAWGDDTPAGRVRDQAVERLQAALAADGLRPVCDRDQIRSGERISAFMRRLTRADCVVAVISDKYLRSPYCMYEIYRIWQRCQADAGEMARRLVPVILPEVRIGSFRERAPYLEFWSGQAAELEALIRRPDLQPSTESWDEVRLVREFAHHVDGILHFLHDVLMPRNVDAHLGDEFLAVRDAVRRLLATASEGPTTATTAAAAAAPRAGVGEASELRVLVLAANPPTGPLDLEAEVSSLEAELRRVRFRDRISLVVRQAVRPDDLLRYVRSVQPRVLHFSGRGSKTGITLRGDGDGEIEVTGATLGRFLAGRGVELLVLNACYTNELSAEAGRSVGAVVGTTGVIDDEQARRFATAFYRCIGDGLSIREALRDGADSLLLHGLQDAFRGVGELDRVLLQ